MHACIVTLFQDLQATALKRALSVGSVVSLVFFCCLASADDDQIRHSFLGFGKANRVVWVGEDDAVIWKFDYPASDGCVLKNGNVLVSLYPTKAYPAGGVVEVNPKDDTVVFSYQGQQAEISTAIKRDNGNYVIAELGAEPRVVEVNARGGVVSTMPFQCQKKNAHMQTRMLRVLPNGNYIAPHLLDFAVKEYEPKTGQVVRVFKTDDRGREKKDWPFTAIRLKSGHTLIGCTNGNRVIEIDAAGKIVWSVDNDDLGEALFNDACGVQRLANGNTVVTSYHAHGDSVKLFEVTRDKNVVWRYSGMDAGFHHFQILTTDGKTLEVNGLR
ncbi:MAG: hypothetical protein ABGW78_13835 [Pirellulales bacterium]